VKQLPEQAALSILQLADLEDPRVGEQVLSLAAGLSALGHAVTVAGPLNKRLQERLRRLGVRWARLPWPEAAEAVPWRGTAQQLARLLEGRPPDLVHAHGAIALRLAATATSRLPAERRPALVTSLYRVPRHLSPLARWRRRRDLRPALGPGAAVLLSSQADKQALLALLGPAAERAEVVYPAVPETARPSGVEVGLVRRRLGLTAHAAVVGLRTSFQDAEYATLLRAAARVHETLPNVEFAFLGEGPRQAEAQRLAHELGLGGATVFLGRPRSMAEALGALNALALLSDAEGAPLEALQALGYGLPVIAAQVGALAELLEGMPRTQLVPTDDPQALTAALLAALHLIPAGEPAETVETESGRLAGLEQFLVSRRFWDLDRPWQRTAAPLAHAERDLPSALARFLPEAVTRQTLAVYRAVLDKAGT
jgi:glycosyltransferase involved in cell wall biosynthesis